MTNEYSTLGIGVAFHLSSLILSLRNEHKRVNTLTPADLF